MVEKIQLKALLFEKCNQIIQHSIDISMADMNHAQQSANEETKSSAGDKYETGRAMSQSERDRSAKLLSEAKRTQNLLRGIDYKSLNKTVKSGCVVLTSTNNYFISAAIGKVEVLNVTYFAISPISPIAQKMLSQKKGFLFDFNATKSEIFDVF